VYEYDADTAVSPIGGGAYRGTVTDRYSIGPYPNGGYVVGVALSAVAAELPHPDPMSVSAVFLRPCDHGPAEIRVETMRTGRTVSTASASLFQNDVERLRLLANYTDLSRSVGPTVVTAVPPPLPPLEECASRGIAPAPNGLIPTIGARFDTRFDPATVGWAGGRRSGRGEVGGWQRFADDRPLDTAALPLVCDGMPPAVFNLVPTGWVPTIEYTVLVRARPAGGWWRSWFTTRALIGGLLEEDGEIWDGEDRLVAQSRQLARANPPPPD